MCDVSVVPEPPASAAPVCCPRHALQRPLLAGAIWLAAAVAALTVAAVPYDAGESLCGAWGCFPPLPALVAMHLFWGVAFAAGVWAVRRRPRLLRTGGAAVFVAAGLTAAAVVGRDVLEWVSWASPDVAGYWPRRAAYVLATKNDLPLVQAAAAGAAGMILGGRSSLFSGGAMKFFAFAAAVVAVFVAVWAVGRAAHPAGTVTAADPPAPEFVGITDWVNTNGIKLADQSGKVVVVHFLTNGCINCVHNYPHYRAWQEKYKDERGFLMVGVHTPEFDADRRAAGRAGPAAAVSEPRSGRSG